MFMLFVLFSHSCHSKGRKRLRSADWPWSDCRPVQITARRSPCPSDDGVGWVLDNRSYVRRMLQCNVTSISNIRITRLTMVVAPTDLHIYNLDAGVAASPIHVVRNHAGTDKLTTANGGTFTSSSARLNSQSRQSTSVTDRACCNVTGYWV